MIYFTREHSNENEHEQKSSDGEYQHEYSLHEACCYMFCLIINLIYLSFCFLNILLLQTTHLLYHSLILLELLFESLRELLHSLYHIYHIVLKIFSLLCLVSFNFVVIDGAPFPLLRLFLLTLFLL